MLHIFGYSLAIEERKMPSSHNASYARSKSRVANSWHQHAIFACHVMMVLVVVLLTGLTLTSAEFYINGGLTSIEIQNGLSGTGVTD